jgi:UDP-N-acetylmuramoylalanine--D-glutamate ligase
MRHDGNGSAAEETATANDVHGEERMTGTTVAGKNVSVIGAARSGVAVAGLLQSRGARVFVSDAGPKEKLSASLQALEALGVPYEAGGHSDRLYDADFVVLSPGVPSDAPPVREALRRNIAVVSEIEAASWFCPAPIIAITGTNGKTTTTTLVGRMLHDDKRKHVVAGNIGTAFAGVVGELDADSVAVLEVSSFQLDHVQTFRPHVSVILNITPDHLDRYGGSFERYAEAKMRIVERQTADDAVLYNADDEMVVRMMARFAHLPVRTMPFGLALRGGNGAGIDNGVLVTVVDGRRHSIVRTEEMSLRGIHNQYNAMAATLAAQLVGVRPASLRATLRNFKGVEHRLEFVRELDGVKFVNDSKATNVDSVWYALQAFREPLVLLLGGRDKGNDYGRIADLVREHVSAIIAIGESADKVAASFTGIVPVRIARSMQEAILSARQTARRGDVVLLSPACASFDWFENYEHRGRVFKELVLSL